MNNDSFKHKDVSNYPIYNTFGNNTSGIQIQQNTSNSSQNQTLSTNFDYDAVSHVLNEINKYESEFENLYGDTAKDIKELTIGISGSLIATGLLELIKPFI